MPDALDELLAREPFAILDGALATELERGGCDLDDPLWSARVLLEQPERVVAVHRRWLEAGAEIITSASYQATIPGLVARGLDERQARALVRRSVELAHEAVQAHGSGGLVAASIGSYGAYLADGSEYRGDYGHRLGRAALADFHRPRLRELEAAGPDLLAFETIPSAVEAEAIAALLDEGEGKAPRAWISFSLSGRSGATGEPVAIADGTSLREAMAPLLDQPRLAAVGVNCVAPEAVGLALEVFAALRPGLPLIAYPNSGEEWIERDWAGQETEPRRFASLARQWLQSGARVIGGCCRTRPGHVAALRSLRDSLRT